MVVDDPSHPISFDVTGEGSLGRVDTTGTITSDPDWHHIVGTWDGTTMRVYIDGSVDPTTDPRAGNVDRAGKELWIGHGDHAIEKAWSYPWDGALDEVRISDLARSPDWITAQHKSMTDTFATYGGAENASPWWDGSWGKRVPITITYAGRGLTNYQVKVDVAYNADMQPDFDDIRFIDSAHTTELDYYRESDYTASSSAVFWVEVPSIPDGGKTIYMYYDNAGVSTTSSGPNTFEYFDDFESFSTGSVNGQDSWVAPAGSASNPGQIMDSNAFDGTKQLEHYNSSDHGSGRILNLGGDRMIDFRLNLITKGPNTTSDTKVVLFDDEGSDVSIKTRRETSETNWRDSYNGATHDTGVAFSEGSWTRVRIGVFNSGTMDYWIGGTQVYNDLSQNFDDFQEIQFYTDENAGIRFDEAFIRKYVSSEPTTSVDPEEDPLTYSQVAEGGLPSSSSESLASANNNCSLPFGSGDYLYLGSTSKFTGVNIDLQQAGAGGTLNWQYWNGAWANLSNVTGAAKNFTASGFVHFDQPSDWAKTSVNGGPSLYYVRAYL
ncbi:MAG: DUF2341 domain-containing protein, partial [Candidatus Hydrogenedentes bacterium]|nr:DUF2341 domain-containing protein [Candidatus Hydrogenedentota bacterium]